MRITKCLSQQSVALVTLLLLSIILVSTISSVTADSTTLYLDWNLVENTDVYGHLTLSGVPETMEYNQTYKVEITLTLESYDPHDLRKLDFYLNTSSTGRALPLGNCAINSTLHRAESFTLYSHWKIEHDEISPFLTEGKLLINSTIGKTATEKTLETTPRDITIKLKESSILELTDAKVKIVPFPNPLNLIEEVSVEGNLKNSSFASIDYITWSKISLTYLSPNGTEIIRQVSTNDIGHFTDKFVPDLVGTWRVKATWNGTEKYSAATSSVKLFEVQGPNQWILPIAIVVFAFLIFISPAIYWFKDKDERILGPKKMTRWNKLIQFIQEKRSK